jgi:gentisate 1,2-dioxygenase
VRYGTAGLLPLSPTDERQVEGPGSGIHSRLLTYRWADTDAALAGLLEAKNGNGYASVRFSDPATGRDIMPTLRAEMHRIAPGGQTPATRTADIFVLSDRPVIEAVGLGRIETLPGEQAGDRRVRPLSYASAGGLRDVSAQAASAWR